MTKKEMIAAIQLIEAQEFLKLKEYDSIYGITDGLTDRARIRFVAVADLMEALGIKPDITLPESDQAMALILNK
jgi:hypothetical protein